MIYGYARVSTKKQQKDGNSLEGQEKSLREAGAEIIYKEAFTGTKNDRPEFNKLLEVVKEGDIIIATKLDRVSRSASQGIALVDELLARGVSVNILNLGLMDDSPTGKLIRNIFFSFAEFERDMIVTRTTEGRELARERPDYKEGRPVKELSDFQKFLEKQKKGQLTVSECCEQMGISRSTWYARVREVA